MNATSTGQLFQGYIADVGNILKDNLGAALLIGAAVFGLVVLVRLARRWIAGR